jgi:hypothetical protein
MSVSKIATPGRSSAEIFADLPPPARPREAAAVLAWPGRVALLALNFVPLLHLSGVGLIAVLPPWAWWTRLLAAAAVLWLVPPLLCRLVLAVRPLNAGRHALGSTVFWAWWISLQLQTLFARVPVFEEMLRLIPGAYSLWLRLWGARVGRLTYWAPGLEITDRSLLDVGDDVVLGGKARLGAHLLHRTAEGTLELLIGRIRLGHRVMVGAQAALGPGAELADDENTHAFFLAPPFSRWRGGKRARDEASLSPRS